VLTRGDKTQGMSVPSSVAVLTDIGSHISPHIHVCSIHSFGSMSLSELCSRSLMMFINSVFNLLPYHFVRLSSIYFFHVFFFCLAYLQFCLLLLYVLFFLFLMYLLLHEAMGAGGGWSVRAADCLCR
jgi:hypothetical protein